jgi:hypothetical protein
MSLYKKRNLGTHYEYQSIAAFQNSETPTLSFHMLQQYEQKAFKD